MKLCTLLLLYTFMMPGIAQEIKHPGTGRDLKDVTQSAEGVCVAEFENLGTPDLGSLGSTYYSGAILKVRRNLEDGEFKTLSCAYSVQTYPESSKEVAPTLGKTFLMLGSFSGGRFEIKKLVEPTTRNVGLVEEDLRRRGIKISPQTETTSREAVQPEPETQAHQFSASLPSNTPIAQTGRDLQTGSPRNTSSESTSSAPWSIIGVLILAAMGLLWLLLKRPS